MTDREQGEYRALRATIQERGTTRVWVFVFGMAAWAALALGTLALALPPVATLITLLVLVATFEAVLALHVGVERVGRYLLVFHDDEWERAAGQFGRPPGGITLDALFTPAFAIATIANLTPLLATIPIVQELVVVGVAHAIVLARIFRARAAAARQRAVDTERFRDLRR